MPTRCQLNQIIYVIPVTLSERIRDVMICPKGLKSASKSSWLIVLARPLTYKLAPLIDSLLGRANDTLNINVKICWFLSLSLSPSSLSHQIKCHQDYLKDCKMIRLKDIENIIFFPSSNFLPYFKWIQKEAWDSYVLESLKKIINRLI